jgi:hypothetical protein
MRNDDFNELVNIYQKALALKDLQNSPIAELAMGEGGIQANATIYVSKDDIQVSAHLLIRRYQTALRHTFDQIVDFDNADPLPFYDTACLIVTSNPNGLEEAVNAIEDTIELGNKHIFDFIDLSDLWTNHYEHAFLVFGRSDKFDVLKNLVEIIKVGVAAKDLDPRDVQYTWYAFMPSKPMTEPHRAISRYVNYAFENTMPAIDQSLVTTAFEGFVLHMCSIKGADSTEHNIRLFSDIVDSNLMDVDF